MIWPHNDVGFSPRRFAAQYAAQYWEFTLPPTSTNGTQKPQTEDVHHKYFTISNKNSPVIGDPHIHLSSQRTTDRLARPQSHLDYLMVLEFGEYNAEDRVQPGKIYLCLPDRGKSFLAGSFEARVD